ncbi:MAG: reverse transcriptase/maturase family protein [Lentisphaeria bacterium]|nr:reverse transcriptase/maturase family protein [Lentisphaeria bacterium]
MTKGRLFRLCESSLARAMKGLPDPVFGKGGQNTQTAQQAWAAFSKDRRYALQPVELAPYSKKTGRLVFGFRQATDALLSSQRESSRGSTLKVSRPFGSRYRLIAKLRPVDKMIAKTLAHYLYEILEGRLITDASVLHDHCYAYRKHLGVHDALDSLEAWIKQGFVYVLRADITSFFDRIRHDRVEQQLTTLFGNIGLADPLAVEWIMAFCRTKRQLSWKVTRGPEETGVKKSNSVPFPGSGRGNAEVVFPSEIGIPQGSPLSAPLSNLYLTETDAAMVADGLENDYRYLRYADDIMVCAKTQAAAAAAKEKLVQLCANLGLELSEKKTSIDHVDSGTCTFLGFHYLSLAEGKKISREKVDKFRQKIIHLTSKAHLDNLKPGEDKIEQVITSVNRRILVTRNGGKPKTDESDTTPSSRLSAHSFVMHYRHGEEEAIRRQMVELDRFIHWRVARCLTPGDIPHRKCVHEFFKTILPAKNRQRLEEGKRPLGIIRLPKLFRAGVQSVRGDCYGLDN